MVLSSGIRQGTNVSSQPPDADFSQAARFYAGRVPYLPHFFSVVAERVGLTKDSVVLDLGCGTAELSIGFSPYCASVLAIDRSPEMLSACRINPGNVSFLVADLNTEAVAVA